MAYIGNPPAEAYTNTVKDSFNGDGSTVAFTMSQPSVTNDVRVVVENVIQDPTVAYSCSGTTLTFTSAPPSGTDNIYVVHLGPAVMTTVPPSDIASATTFASNVTVQGAFTSPGIDDNANATAITIDGSENVLVGTTDPDGGINGSSTQGISLSSGSFIGASRSSGNVLELNRQTTDGTIANFRKDGTTVGGIGVNNSLTYITTNGGFGVGSGITFDSTGVLPTTRTGGVIDNAFDVGSSSYRFKDLYLSGGVYLGGVGSSNLLDDYEEGTWTITSPTAAGFSISAIDAQECYYQKSGKWVSICGYVKFTVPSSPETVVIGDYIAFSPSSLPFLPEVLDGISVNSQLGTCHMYNSYGGSENTFGFMTWTGGNVYLYIGQSVTGSPQSNNPIYFVATYRTD